MDTNTGAIKGNSYSITPKLLHWAATLWFVVAVVGQWIFVVYLLLAYGSTAAHGNLAAWSQKLTHGYVPGDFTGNLAVIAHLSLAVIILLAGPLQLVPQIRARFPRYHRWSGRVYLGSVFLTTIAGLYMLLIHGTVGDWTLILGMFLDALLIILFGALALRAALRRNFASHRRWALRLFMVVSAVWFFRIGLMLWLVIFQAPVGFNPDTFIGPFATFMAFAQYLIPLALLELYFCAQASASSRLQGATALLLVFMTLAMVLGIFGAIMGLWLPAL